MLRARSEKKLGCSTAGVVCFFERSVWVPAGRCCGRAPASTQAATRSKKAGRFRACSTFAGEPPGAVSFVFVFAREKREASVVCAVRTCLRSPPSYIFYIFR